MTEVYTKTAFVPYYAFVCPVYDLRALDDLQVIDEVELAELYAVYAYCFKSMRFKPFAYRDTELDARETACKKHVEIAKKMAEQVGMSLADETMQRITQAEDGTLDEAIAELWEDEE